jgi:hypothetical protein
LVFFASCGRAALCRAVEACGIFTLIETCPGLLFLLLSLLRVGKFLSARPTENESLTHPGLR